MSAQQYDQSDNSGPWIDFKEHIYPSGHHRVLRQHHAKEVDDRGKPKKRFLQFHYAESDREIGTGHGHWEAGCPEELELYVRPDARNVIHVEGEACAEFVNEKLSEAGLKDWIATTSPGGSKAWRAELAKDYKGRHVYGSPDWQQDGYDYISAVMGSAKEAGALVLKVVEIEGETRGDDLKDWLERDGNTIQDWIKLAPFATAWTPNWKPSLFKPIEAELDMVCLDDVQTKKIEWIWDQRVARGKITTDAGHPGVGKSSLGADITARITRGGDWPNGEGKAPKGSVILLTSEDDVADTIKPRVLAAGGDPKKVFVIRGKKAKDGKHETFSLRHDLGLLRRAIESVGDVVLVKIDPINAYLGQTSKTFDSYKDSDVRSVFEPIQNLAAELNIAVWATTHFNKSGGTKAITRFLGSIGMVGISRAAYVVVEDEDEESEPGRILFLLAKKNIGKRVKGLAFRIVDKKTGDAVVDEFGAVEWEGETDVTADQALNQRKPDGRSSAKLERAKEIIEKMIAAGPVHSQLIFDACEKEGIKEKPVWNAYKKLKAEGRVEWQRIGRDHFEWMVPAVIERDAAGNELM